MSTPLPPNAVVDGSPSGVPLLIGVTGHRSIAPELIEPLREAVKQVLSDIGRDYPQTPLVLLSPLSAGADQLVVEAALDGAASHDVQLVTVLPWPRELDAEVGTPAGERGRCDRLIDRAVQVVTMPLVEGVDAAQLGSDPAAREQQFDQAGRYIARHCQILIAVWDGNTASGSHTAKVVRYHSEGAPAPFTARVGALDTPEQAAVCHLSTQVAPLVAATPATIPPRWIWPDVASESHPRKHPKTLWQRVGWITRFVLVGVHRLLHILQWDWGRSISAGERSLRQRWRSIDHFNGDVHNFQVDPKFEESLRTNRCYLIPDDIAGGLPSSLQRLRDSYGLADTVAGNWQAHTWRAVRWLFAIAFLAIACLEVYAHLFPETLWLALYLGLLACGYLLYRRTQRVGQQGRWLDSRALAEALRVQIFWRWAGLPDCVADHYLRHFRGELDWIRHAARTVDLMTGGHAASPSPSVTDQQRTLQLVLKHWVADQHLFFARSTPGNAELEIAYGTAARLAFAGAVIAAACHLWHHAGTHHMNHALVLTTFGCLVVAAFLEEYAEVRTYALLARRYRWMSALFGTAEARLQAIVKNPEFGSSEVAQAKELLFELGQEALAENADWVIQHRERPPVLPGG